MKAQLPSAQQDTLVRRGYDPSTVEFGQDGPFDPWEHDHTSLVHVLWHFSRAGLTLDDDADEIASLLMGSRWGNAQRSLEQSREETSREYRIVPRVRSHRDRVRLYASEIEYKAEASMHNQKAMRHQYRETGKWIDIKPE